jgi:predicted metal-dependent hydrolase
MAGIPSEINGIPVSLRRSRKRRRTISLALHPHGRIILSAPHNTPQRFIEDFFASRLSWIEKKSKIFKDRAALGIEKKVGRAVEIRCREQARHTIEEKIVHYASLLNVRPRTIRINGARTRWGSCSAKDNLNFSWRIAMLPPDIIDYIIVHELAHIREKNHGPGFWNTVASMLPGYKNPKSWLRKNSHLFIA